MRALNTEPTQEELNRTFARLKECLKPEVLEEVMHMGIRESMINEYRDLATAASDLIKLHRKSGFAPVLEGEHAEDYENILARFSTSGQRFRVLIEESSSVDEVAMLAIAPRQSSCVN
ncbi:hypothetical protein [Desulfovibrio ferrophilus]|uniref:Uncharacterized protein n=1 Tax=Desulfovibrio ferrophilus TaxID=241368 RepID=A0A2Z6B0R8_9BACT|nr:hypothetical protein [Desulfovibrio ferrophilus]BBD09053.1 uncharacterized protein DFE_2327 [Desulfovibrio ferrophilus]